MIDINIMCTLVRKNYLFLVVLIGLLIPYSFVGAQTFDKDLYFGLQNDPDVTKLQEFLTDEGLYSGPITGNFFSLTLKGVINYQSREGISPAAGYFGPKSRLKANTVLSSQLAASENQAIQETGSTTTPPLTPKTTTDVISSLQSQMNILLQQVVLLQQQLQAQQQTQQSVQNLQNQVAQQTQTLQQIQQNTQSTQPTQTNQPAQTIISTPVEVKLQELTNTEFGIVPSITSANFIISNNNQDKITLEVNGKTYTSSWGQVLVDNLSPETEYYYSLRVERNDKYAIKNGSFTTKQGLSCGEYPYDFRESLKCINYYSSSILLKKISLTAFYQAGLESSPLIIKSNEITVYNQSLKSEGSNVYFQNIIFEFPNNGLNIPSINAVSSPYWGENVINLIPFPNNGLYLRINSIEFEKNGANMKITPDGKIIN